MSVGAWPTGFPIVASRRSLALSSLGFLAGAGVWASGRSGDGGSAGILVYRYAGSPSLPHHCLSNGYVHVRSATTTCTLVVRSTMTNAPEASRTRSLRYDLHPKGHPHAPSSQPGVC